MSPLVLANNVPGCVQIGVVVLAEPQSAFLFLRASKACSLPPFKKAQLYKQACPPFIYAMLHVSRWSYHQTGCGSPPATSREFGLLSIDNGAVYRCRRNESTDVQKHPAFLSLSP